MKQKKLHRVTLMSLHGQEARPGVLYGFTETYRETKDIKYLEQANKIAAFILSNPNLPANKIPYWDFNTPYDIIPNALRKMFLQQLSWLLL